MPNRITIGVRGYRLPYDFHYQCRLSEEDELEDCDDLFGDPTRVPAKVFDVYTQLPEGAQFTSCYRIRDINGMIASCSKWTEPQTVVAVPEPSVTAALIIGAMLIEWMRRRRKA